LPLGEGHSRSGLSKLVDWLMKFQMEAEDIISLSGAERKIMWVRKLFIARNSLTRILHERSDAKDESEAGERGTVLFTTKTFASCRIVQCSNQCMFLFLYFEI
jgi:hypothetical protein